MLANDFIFCCPCWLSLLPPIGFFLIGSVEQALLNAILKECQGDNFRFFSLCFEKAYNESLVLWLYLLPFLPAGLLACGRWVLGIPRPLFALSGSRVYLIAEGFLVLLGLLVTVSSVHDAAAKPIDQLYFLPFFRSFYFALAAVGAPWILSMLLQRTRAELSHKIVRWSILIVLVAPFVEIVIIISRWASGA